MCGSPLRSAFDPDKSFLLTLAMRVAKHQAGKVSHHKPRLVRSEAEAPRSRNVESVGVSKSLSTEGGVGTRVEERSLPLVRRSALHLGQVAAPCHSVGAPKSDRRDSPAYRSCLLNRNTHCQTHNPSHARHNQTRTEPRSTTIQIRSKASTKPSENKMHDAQLNTRFPFT